MKFGDAFTMAVPPRYDTPHLFFVISDPSKNGGEYVIVNITTDYIRAGRECVLNVGDHDWIREASFVSFGDARKIGSDTPLEKLIGTLVVMRTPLKPETLKIVSEAAKQSTALTDELKTLL